MLNDEEVARNLQNAELGQVDAPVLVGVTPVVVGVPARPVHMPVVAAVVADLPVEEMIVLNYSKAVAFFALMDLIVTVINAVAVFGALRGSDTEPTVLTFGLVAFLYFLGPVAGAIGSRTLNYPLTVIYAAYCFMKLISHIFFGIYMFFL